MASKVARDLSSVRAERADVGVVRGSIPRGPLGSFFFLFCFCFEVGVSVVGRMVVARARAAESRGEEISSYEYRRGTNTMNE